MKSLRDRETPFCLVAALSTNRNNRFLVNPENLVFRFSFFATGRTAVSARTQRILSIQMPQASEL